MRSLAVTAVALVLSGSTAVSAFAAQSPEAPVAVVEPLVFVVEFEDGRQSHQPVGPRGATAWTPMFPRVPDWRLPDGTLPVAAVRYSVQRSASGVHYSVSVLLGPEHQREEPVASGSIRRDQRVTVDGLLRYGVRPITLAVRPLAAAAFHEPAVVNHTSGIHVSAIEVLTDPAPRYRVTIENLTDRDALSVTVATRRAGTLAHSGVQGHEEGEPIVRAHGTHRFDWPFATGPHPALPRGAWAPLPVDELVVSSVVWADGTYEGASRSAAVQRVRDLARLILLGRLVPLLQQAATSTAPVAETLQRLHRDIEALPIDNDTATLTAALARMPEPEAMGRDEVDRLMRTARQRVKTLASGAVRAAQHSYDGSKDDRAGREALAAVLQRFSAWRDRLTRP